MKVSVLINSLNQGQYIEKAIKSVLAQDYPRNSYEIVVVDAGSTDNTLQILKKYSPELKIVYQKGKLGLARGCNIGIRECKGEYIVRLDADDEFCQHILMVESIFLDENSEFGFVYPDYYLKKNGILKRFSVPSFDVEEICQRGDFLGGGTMYRRNIFEQYGYYDESFTTLENYELILRLIKNNVKGHHIKLPLFIYNLHEDSMGHNIAAVLEDGKKLEAKYGIKYGMGKYYPRNMEN